MHQFAWPRCIHSVSTNAHISLLVLLLPQLFVPGVTIAYFLIGFPSKSYGFFLLVAYTLALATESMLALITKFTKNAAHAIIAAQAILVCFTVFAGGLFISFDKVPK